MHPSSVKALQSSSLLLLGRIPRIRVEDLLRLSRLTVEVSSLQVLIRRFEYPGLFIFCSERIFVQGIWKCKGIESGTPFSEVDLIEGEWTDYDEKVGVSLIWRLNLLNVIKATQPVSVMNIESEWSRA